MVGSATSRRRRLSAEQRLDNSLKLPGLGDLPLLVEVDSRTATKRLKPHRSEIQELIRDPRKAKLGRKLASLFIQEFALSRQIGEIIGEMEKLGKSQKSVLKIDHIRAFKEDLHVLEEIAEVYPDKEVAVNERLNKKMKKTRDAIKVGLQNTNADESTERIVPFAENVSESASPQMKMKEYVRMIQRSAAFAIPLSLLRAETGDPNEGALLLRASKDMMDLAKDVRAHVEDIKERVRRTLRMEASAAAYVQAGETAFPDIKKGATGRVNNPGGREEAKDRRRRGRRPAPPPKPTRPRRRKDN